MEFSTLLILVGIGLGAGVASGFVGIGGGMVMVPALIYIMGFTQHQAQGISIATMLPPIGILAFMSYWNSGNVNKSTLVYAGIMAVAFVLGGLIGSKLSLKMNPNLVKLIFGSLLLFVAGRMVMDGMKFFWEK